MAGGQDADILIAVFQWTLLRHYRSSGRWSRHVGQTWETVPWSSMNLFHHPAHHTSAMSHCQVDPVLGVFRWKLGKSLCNLCIFFCLHQHVCFVAGCTHGFIQYFIKVKRSNVCHNVTFLKNTVIVVIRKNLYCYKRKWLFHKHQTARMITAKFLIVCVLPFSPPTASCYLTCWPFPFAILFQVPSGSFTADLFCFNIPFLWKKGLCPNYVIWAMPTTTAILPHPFPATFVSINWTSGNITNS